MSEVTFSVHTVSDNCPSFQLSVIFIVCLGISFLKNYIIRVHYCFDNSN